MPENISSPPDDSKLLETGPISFLPRQEAQALLARCRTLRMKPGEQLIREGRYPAELIVAVDGLLKRVNSAGAASAGEMISPYRPIGLDCLLRSTAYPYSVYAEQDSTIRIIPWKDLKPLIERVPHLEEYLRLTAEYAFLNEMDLTLEDMNCSPAFRRSLLGALKSDNMPQDTWIVKEGEVPGFVFYGVSGTVQAFRKGDDGALKALWIAPNQSWQLFDPCLNKTALTHNLKAVSKVDIYRLSLRALESLKKSLPEDFAAFAKVATRVKVEKDEAEEEDKDVERLEDLFPTPPKPTRSLRFSYPFVMQNDEMDCAPACMAMISKYYGNDLPVQFWRARMNTNQEGTSLFDLAKAAEKVGFVSHGLALQDLLQVEANLFPLIALRQYHYLVIYRADARGVLVGDPGIAVRRMPWEEFKKGFDGYVLMLKPTEQFYQEQAPQQGYWHYLAMFKGQGLELALILATSLVLTVFQMAPAFFSQFILDEVLAKQDTRLMVLVITAALIVAAMSGVVSWLRSYYLSFVTARFDFAAMSAFMRKLFSLPYDFFATRHVGDFTRRLAELERVQQFVTGQMIETVLNFWNIAVYAVVLFMYSPQVAASIYIAAPLMVVLAVLFSHKLQKQSSEAFASRAEQEGLLADQIKGVATIKTLGAEVASRWRFEEALVATLRSRYNLQITGASLSSCSSFLYQFMDFGIIGLAAYMAIKGQLTPGQVMSVSIMAASILGPVQSLANMWSDIQQMRTTLDRLNDVFLAESESRPDKRALIKQRLRGEMEFRDVWFRYGGESTDWVLKGMSFRILPGQSVAVVGSSGAGKSTLALLATRLYEPTKGIILIDGRDYREYDRPWLRRQIGLLLQETTLFHGSILENIAYGDPRPEMALVEAAAEMANAKDFIYEKSSGYDFRITHGGLGLSGGQKQRIAIARILYVNPAILFLDEATASLDANAERAIVKNLKEAGKNRTLLSIAHRYNTVRMSDFAMVVEGGQVVEMGTHTELIKKDGHYAKLFGDQIAL